MASTAQFEHIVTQDERSWMKHRWHQAQNVKPTATAAQNHFTMVPATQRSVLASPTKQGGLGRRQDEPQPGTHYTSTGTIGMLFENRLDSTPGTHHLSSLSPPALSKDVQFQESYPGHKVKT